MSQKLAVVWGSPRGLGEGEGERAPGGVRRRPRSGMKHIRGPQESLRQRCWLWLGEETPAFRGGVHLMTTFHEDNPLS